MLKNYLRNTKKYTERKTKNARIIQFLTFFKKKVRDSLQNTRIFFYLEKNSTLVLV